MAKIAYENKVSNGGTTPNGIFTSANANEIKESVNYLYDLQVANKTPIPIIPTIDEEFVIDWQTDLVPNDPLERTYAERFGNIISLITNAYDEGSQSVEFITSHNGNLIETVTIPANILQDGFLNIII